MNNPLICLIFIYWTKAEFGIDCMDFLTCSFSYFNMNSIIVVLPKFTTKSRFSLFLSSSWWCFGGWLFPNEVLNLKYILQHNNIFFCKNMHLNSKYGLHSWPCSSLPWAAQSSTRRWWYLSITIEINTTQHGTRSHSYQHIDNMHFSMIHSGTAPD